MKTAITALLLLCLPTLASAEFFANEMTFGPAYASGPPLGFPWSGTMGLNTPLTLVGVITSVGAPLKDHLPSPPYELTMVIEATSSNVGNFDGPCTGGTYWAFYESAIAIYLDTTPDADFANPSTFRDGEMILQADVSPISIKDDDPAESCPMAEDAPDLFTQMWFTGGTWFPFVSDLGVGYYANAHAEIAGHAPDVPPELQALGYVLRVDGGLDLWIPVMATKPTTWGAVKSLYR